MEINSMQLILGPAVIELVEDGMGAIVQTSLCQTPPLLSMHVAGSTAAELIVKQDTALYLTLDN
jgi:hypothetical protein